jgi:hypothetical protein
VAGDTFYVHGGLIGSFRDGATDCYGYVPGAAGRVEDAHDWVRQLNQWYSDELAEWAKQPEWEEETEEAYLAGKRGGHGLMDYVVPNSLPSVVLGLHLNAKGMPAHLPESIMRPLNKSGLMRMVIGHTPHGNCPTVIKSGSAAQGSAHFETIMADTSYSDMSKPDNRGVAVSAVAVRADSTTHVHGILQDGRPIDYRLQRGIGPSHEIVGLEEPQHADHAVERCASAPPHASPQPQPSPPLPFLRRQVLCEGGAREWGDAALPHRRLPPAV